jgi:exosome complex RNA-binding protein Rrp4
MNELVEFANSAGIVFKDPNAHLKKRRLNSGDLLGLMVYDYHMMPYEEMKAKWVQFIRLHDGSPKTIKESILTLSGAQNTTANSLAKKSRRIAIYLAENGRIATEDELANVTHPRNDSSEEVESIEEDREEDDSEREEEDAEENEE